jgi:hypothetical protein
MTGVVSRERFARYWAASARRSSWAGSVSGGGASVLVATPQATPSGSTVSARSQTCSAVCTTSSAGTPRSTRQNSSPPSRATVQRSCAAPMRAITAAKALSAESPR